MTRSRIVACLAAAGLLGAAGCGGSTVAGPKPSPSPSPSGHVVGMMPLSTHGGPNLFAYVDAGQGSDPSRVAANLASVDPGVIDGISWVLRWADVEPSQGRYNWTTLDSDLNVCSTQHRLCMVRIIAGRSSPSWYSPKVTFTYTNAAKNKVTASMPITWSTDFVTAWTRFIAAYGARYANDPRIDVVQMAGAGVLGEMSLPNWSGWDSAAPPPDGAGSDPYSSAQMVSAWNTIIDAYRAAFPSKLTALDIGNPRGDSSVLPGVLAHVRPMYPAVAIQENGLGAILYPQSVFAQIIKAEAERGTNTGWQFNLGNMGPAKLSAGFQTSTQTHARYVEVYLVDILKQDPE